MLSYLLDTLHWASVLDERGGPRHEFRWTRVVEAFLLKYPGVHICTAHLYNRWQKRGTACPPGGFLVWRVGKNQSIPGLTTFYDAGSLSVGDYFVQLFPSCAAARAEGYRLRTGRERVVVAYTAAEAEAAGDNAVLTTAGAMFDYDAPVGELARYDSFAGMVLPGDRHRWDKSRSGNELADATASRPTPPSTTSEAPQSATALEKKSVIIPCPGCSQKLWVPSEKILVVTCPACRHQFSFPSR
jgi:hypothetical protein